MIGKFDQKLLSVEDSFARVEWIFSFTKTSNLKAKIHPRLFDKIQEIYVNIRKAGKLLMAKANALGMNVKFQQLDFMRTITMSILVMTKNIHKEIGTTFAYYHSDLLYKAIKDKGISGAYGEVPEVKRVGVDPTILNKKFTTVSFFAEIKQSIINYEKDLKESAENDKDNVWKKMKDAQVKAQKEYSQKFEESK